VRGIRKRVLALKVNEALDAVGLSHKKTQNALTLSSGETQQSLDNVLNYARIFLIDGGRGFIEKENLRLYGEPACNRTVLGYESIPCLKLFL
jgi:tungstate transport system ATP-binding protein